MSEDKRPNRWMQQLHKQNDSKPEWCVPKKGSDRYNQIMGLIRRPVRSKSPEGTRIRKVRRHRSSSPRHPNASKVRAHRSNSPRHPMRTTIPRPKRKSVKANIPVNGKNPLIYNKATGLYEKANKPVKEAKNPLVYNKATGLYEKANGNVPKPVKATRPRRPRAVRPDVLPRYADIAPDTYYFDDDIISRANTPPPIIHPDNIDDDNDDDDDDNPFGGIFAPANTRDITEVFDVPDQGRVVPIDYVAPYGNFINDEREALIDDNTILTVSTELGDQPETQAVISGRRMHHTQRRWLEERLLRGNTREVVDVIDDDIQGASATKIQSQFRKYLAGKELQERQYQDRLMKYNKGMRRQAMISKFAEISKRQQRTRAQLEIGTNPEYEYDVLSNRIELRERTDKMERKVKRMERNVDKIIRRFPDAVLVKALEHFNRREAAEKQAIAHLNKRPSPNDNYAVVATSGQKKR